MSVLISCVGFVFGYMCLAFMFATYKKDNSIVDIFWGLGFVLLAYFTLLWGGIYSWRALITTTMVTAWGLRLSGNILVRNIGKPEDFRYAAWRKEWGKWVVLRSFFQVFMLQGLAMIIIAAPIWIINAASPVGVQVLDVLGVVIWAVGFFFEVVGDYQLRVFLAQPNNRGHICTIGLWRYTRHPNYFGEATMWWGLFLLALAVPGGFIAIISPVTITYLLLYVSGVPMLEAQWKGNVEFEAYKKRTSKFFPWFVKRS